MTNFILFLVFSVLETSAMFYLMFKIFKIDLFPKEILFSGIVMAFVSHTLRIEYNLPNIDIVIQFVLMLCFVWMLFRIHIFYASIMTGMIYQAYMLIQTIYFYILDQFGLFTSALPEITSISIYLLQTISALTAFTIGWLVMKKRKGFDFVPDKPNGRLTLQKREKVLFALNMPGFFLFLFTMYLVEHYHQVYQIYVFINASILFGYLYLSYRKDRAQDDYYSA